MEIRMQDAELECLLSDLESDRVERKASAADPDKIRQATRAFANDLPNHRQPGVVFVGVNDDGTCAGLAVTDQLLITLASMRSDGEILPFPMMTVQKQTLRACERAVVTVQPADAPPVRYRGRVWIRVGPRRDIASPQKVRRLAEKRRASDLPFDLQPIAAATLSDLDIDLLQRTYLPSAVTPDVLEANQRTIEQLYTVRRCSMSQTRSGCLWRMIRTASR
jgi:ATP-dependent DNA helicase RecG